MLARAAADFYWMGRSLERAESVGRLLQYQLKRLVDTPADEVALGWQVLYQTVGHPAPFLPGDADEAERFLIADAYTLAGTLFEDTENPDSLVSCWTRARENARQLRPWIPLRMWTCLNQGYLWVRSVDFAAAWAEGPSELTLRALDRLRLLAGVVAGIMPRDDAWRFLELGRHVERLQHIAALLQAWVSVGRPDPDGKDAASAPRLSWSDLLRVCRAYELYRRRRSTRVSAASAIGFLVRNPELPRSLRFSVRRVDELLAGIDPSGARYPLATPHRMAIRLAATVEMDLGNEGREGAAGAGDARARDAEAFAALHRDGCRLHDIIMREYVHYPIEQGLPL